MNASPAMAPLSPMMFPSSPILGSPVPGKHSSSPLKSPTPSLMASQKQWHKSSISRLAEEFFWIGGSIVATPKWRMGQTVERCMCNMQSGTQMVKLRGKSKALARCFYLDEHKSCIRWQPSRKHDKAKIMIDSIHEVREGKKTEMFQRFANRNFDPNCCFSIYHGDHVESLDLVSTNGEEARTWITGLKYLMAGISDEDSLAKRQRTRDQWLKQTFSEADKNGDGSLNIEEVLRLLRKLNVNLPRQKVREMFKEADTDDNQGLLAFEEFCTFYKMMSTRRDLYLLMLTYSNQKDHMDRRDLTRFLEYEQKMLHVTMDLCQEIVNQFEPDPQNQKQMFLGIDGFTNYMRSPAGDIFNPDHFEVNQDMEQPLCNYFIASSHNTYLTGDQLLSQSRVDMYAYVLQAGCRCVEVDCWDGPDGEPIVHHGYTLTSKILFKDVIETINKYAFAKNLYPVILSIENHCTVPQQKKMAEHLIEVLRDKLDLSDVQMNEFQHLPSPEELKGKVLVKGKKLPANIDEDAEEGDVSDEDNGEEDDEDDEPIHDGGTGGGGPETRAESEPKKRRKRSLMGSFKRKKKRRVKIKNKSVTEGPDADPEIPPSADRVVMQYSRRKKTMRLSRALSDLVKYTKSVRVHDIETQAYLCSWQVSSLNESITNQIMQLKPAQLVCFNQRQLLRVYPSNYRVDSSNYNPQPFWNTGCHLVALNYQTEGRMLQLNRAKFACNGNCGYVLKPRCMCKGAFNPMLDDPLPGQRRYQLVLKVISGQQLPKPKDSMLGDRGEIIDPFVEVEIVGLNVDCCKEQTRVVDDNGFNPMWEETLVFKVHMPQIALVRFMVWDHEPIGRNFIGQRTIAFNSLMPGYRHVYLEGLEEASIFVHVTVNDVTGKTKSSNAVKEFCQRNLKQSYEDNTKVGANILLRSSGAGKDQSKPANGSSETSLFPSVDFSQQRLSDDQGSQGSRVASILRGAQSEPLKRAQKVSFQEPQGRRLGILSCMSSTISSAGVAGTAAAANCINSAAQHKPRSPPLQPDWPSPPHQEGAPSNPPDGPPAPSMEGVAISAATGRAPLAQQEDTGSDLPDWAPGSHQEGAGSKTEPGPRNSFVPRSAPQSQSLSIPATPARIRRILGAPGGRHSRSVPHGQPHSPGCRPPPPPNPRTALSWRQPLRPLNPGSCGTRGASLNHSHALSDSDSSSSQGSLDSIDLNALPTRFPGSAQPAAGTLQRELNALFDQKMREIRCKSPLFFNDRSAL